MKQKKIYLVLILVGLLGLAANLKTTDPLEVPTLPQKTITAVQEVETPVKTQSTGQILRNEVDVLKQELADVNVEGELNNSSTSQERREWIILRMNLYAKKMAQISRLEIARMNEEMEQ